MKKLTKEQKQYKKQADDMSNDPSLHVNGSLFAAFLTKELTDEYNRLMSLAGIDCFDMFNDIF